MKSKFILLSHQRCGTHMVGSALKQHPYLDFHDYELLIYDGTPEQYKDHFVGWHQANEDGIIVHVDRIMNSYPLFLYFLQHKHNFKILHIHRENVLERCASEILANQTQIWRSSQHQPNNITIEVPPKTLFKLYLKYKSQNELVQFLNFPCIYHILYEEVVANMSLIFKKIQQFLEIPIHPIEPSTIKQICVPMHILIDNYDDLQLMFQNTALHKYFNHSR